MFKKIVFLVVLALVLLGLPSQAVQADGLIHAKMKPFFPGDRTVLHVEVRGSYDLKIHYWGPLWYGWWAWGSGPATAIYGTQYWMECGYAGCTEWWRATVPGHTKDLILIPLETNPTWKGTEHPNAVSITGTVNDREVNLSVSAKSKN